MIAEMEIKKAAVAGTMESSDVYVEIKPASDIAVQIESVVAQQFGEEIERVVRARVETAIRRGEGERDQ